MAAPIPATGIGWDTASPPSGEPHGNDYNEHQESKLALEIRNNKEHTAYGAASAGGEHKPGSAVVYFGDFSASAAGDALPTKRPDASAPWTSGGTALSSADYGRLAYDTDAVFGGIMYRYTSTGWVAMGYMNLLTAQTIAGVKTFSSSPIVPTPTTDMQASTKKYVDDISALFGVRANKSIDTSYEATTDGIVVACSGILYDSETLIILSDASDPPETEVAYFSTYLSGSGRWISTTLIAPVTKGNFWMVTSSRALRFLYWVSVGS